MVRMGVIIFETHCRILLLICYQDWKFLSVHTYWTVQYHGFHCWLSKIWWYESINQTEPINRTLTSDHCCIFEFFRWTLSMKNNNEQIIGYRLCAYDLKYVLNLCLVITTNQARIVKSQKTSAFKLNWCRKIAIVLKLKFLIQQLVN